MMEWKENMNGKDFFTTLQEIYNCLEDDISRELFKKRITLSTIDFNNLKSTDISNNLKSPWEALDKMHEKFLSISKNETIIFYGIGNMGECILKYFNITANDYKNIIFCDRQGDKIEKFHNFPVITPQKLINEYRSKEIIITLLNYQEEIYEYLTSNGIEDKQIFMCDLDIHYDNEDSPIIVDIKHQYFEDFINYTENKVFVDGGVLNGSTSLRFAKNCPNYKHIYLFEPDTPSYENTLINIEKNKLSNATVYNWGLWSEKTTLKFKMFESELGGNHIANDGEVSVEVNNLDNIFIYNNDNNMDIPTFIKMDIEGAELKALQGGAELIKKYKPKLAISIYHKAEDIIEIPAFIKSLVPEYKLYIRHYATTGSETVLYAVL